VFPYNRHFPPIFSKNVNSSSSEHARKEVNQKTYRKCMNRNEGRRYKYCTVRSFFEEGPYLLWKSIRKS
jgi:hypothetical protein